MFFAIVSLTRSVLGTPSALFSLGPESQALGKTGVTGVADFGAVVLNPAGLSLSGERALWLGYSAARFTPKLEGYTGEPPPQPAFAGAALGLKFPITRAGDVPALTLGLAFTSPGDVIVRAHVPPPETPQFPWLSSRAHALDLGLGLGARLSEDWFLGVGVRGLAGLAGAVSVQGNAGVENETELGLRLAPVIGTILRVAAVGRLGFVYRGALAAPFTVEVGARDLPGVMLPPLHVDGVAHYDPAELALEWARELGATHVAVGLAYKRWSAFEGWLGQSVTCPKEAESCAALPKERVELSDTLSPRLGVAHALDLGRAELLLRAGYAFEPSPLPEQTGSANRWDNTASVITLGYGARLTSTPLSFALAYQLHVLHARAHEKRDPEAAPELTRVKVSGSAQFLGVSMGVTY